MTVEQEAGHLRCGTTRRRLAGHGVQNAMQTGSFSRALQCREARLLPPGAGTPDAVSGVVSPHVHLARHSATVPLTDAEQVLGARDAREARRLARLEIWAASRCVACRWFLLQAPRVTRATHPRDVVATFDPWERDEHTLRLAAAWIVLKAR